MFGRGEGPRGRAGLRPVAPFRTKVQVRQRQKGHAMFDPVCAVRSSRALRPGKGLDGGKEARVARLQLRAGPGTAAGMVGLVALLALTSSGTAEELPAVSTGSDAVVPAASAPPARPRL